MKTRSFGEKNTSTKVESFRPSNAEAYGPDADSALRSVEVQGRGDTPDERNKNDTRKHDHDGANSIRIDIRNLAGFIKTVTAIPTHTPKNFFEQFVLYENAGTFRFYCFDVLNQAWRYVALT